MYKGNFSNSFVKWAVRLFLFPLFVGGKILELTDKIFRKNKTKEVDEIYKYKY